jgi:hypothetical protein
MEKIEEISEEKMWFIFFGTQTPEQICKRCQTDNVYDYFSEIIDNIMSNHFVFQKATFEELLHVNYLVRKHFFNSISKLNGE